MCNGLTLCGCLTCSAHERRDTAFNRLGLLRARLWCKHSNPRVLSFRVLVLQNPLLSNLSKSCCGNVLFTSLPSSCSQTNGFVTKQMCSQNFLCITYRGTRSFTLQGSHLSLQLTLRCHLPIKWLESRSAFSRCLL